MKVASFFAGIGGICYGFKQAGFEISYANEFDTKACDNYRANHQDVNLHQCDVREVTTDSIPEFDVFTGGFPCQPYSIAGKMGGLTDVRGTLFFDIIRILKSRQPPALMLENVKNIKSTNGGKDFEVIISHLKDCGYHVRCEVLGGHTHADIPQCRERMFIVGFLDEHRAKRFEFPGTVTLLKKVDDLIDRSRRVQDKYYYKDSSRYYKMMDECMKKEGIYQMRRSYMRENKSGLCPTLTANMGGGGHNVPVIRDDFGIRKLTPKEALAFQGFPDDFKVVTSDVHIYKQAGNAVVVPLVKRIANQISKAL